MEKFWTYFDDIRPPTRNWWNGRTSCRAGGRCGHNCCGWIMSWWEILMMEYVLCVVKFQFWNRISVQIHLLHFEKRVHYEFSLIWIFSIWFLYSFYEFFVLRFDLMIVKKFFIFLLFVAVVGLARRWLHFFRFSHYFTAFSGVVRVCNLEFWWSSDIFFISLFFVVMTRRHASTPNISNHMNSAREQQPTNQ